MSCCSAWQVGQALFWVQKSPPGGNRSSNFLFPIAVAPNSYQLNTSFKKYVPTVNIHVIQSVLKIQKYNSEEPGVNLCPLEELGKYCDIAMLLKTWVERRRNIKPVVVMLVT